MIRAGLLAPFSYEALGELDWRFVRDYLEIAEIDAEVHAPPKGFGDEGGSGLSNEDVPDMAALAAFSEANG